MFLFRKCFFNFSRISKSLVFPRNVPYINKCFCDSNIKMKKDIPSALSKYELFSEESAHVILDVEEEREKIISNEKEINEFAGTDLKRGVTGIFDIEQLIDILRKEKAEDIFVAKVPEEYNYVEYMVIVSGRSRQHMLALSTFIRKIYKVKTEGVGHIPKLEGRESKKWMALDLGNIALHVFSKPDRELFDLETLWSVGKEYDIQKKDSLDMMTNYAKILASLSPNN